MAEASDPTKNLQTSTQSIPRFPPQRFIRGKDVCFDRYASYLQHDSCMLLKKAGQKLQFRLLASLIVFIGSYFPLSLILLAQDYRYDLLSAPLCWPPNTGTCVLPLQNGTLSLLIFVICLICLIFSLGALATVKPKTPVVIQDAKYIPAELMAYTLPYVVSFMSLEYQDTGKFVGLLIFLGWMFVITYKSGQLILNPLLIVVGWRLYEVTLSYPGNKDVRITSWALSKADLQPNTRCSVATIQDVKIVKLNTAEVDD